MSDDQSDGTIIAVANHLLEQKKCREWKKYAPNIETNKNTLPVHSNRTCVEVQMKAMSLHTKWSGELCCSVFQHQ